MKKEVKKPDLFHPLHYRRKEMITPEKIQDPKFQESNKPAWEDAATIVEFFFKLIILAAAIKFLLI